MPWPIFWAFVLGVFALAAIAFAAVVAAKRKNLPAFVGDLWVKIVAEVVAFGSAGMGLWAAFIVRSEEKHVWLCPALTGILAAVLWKVLQHTVDGFLKQADRVDRTRLEVYRAESRFRSDLLAACRAFVKEKANRTLEVVLDRTHRPSMPDVRRALTPGPHLRHVLGQLAVLLQTRCQEKLGKSVNVRAGVYVNRNGLMTPVYTVSTNQSHSAQFSSYKDHTERFRVDQPPERPSHVVQCLREKRKIMIVADCVGAGETGAFHYFNDAQKSYLRSIVLHFLGEVCDETGAMAGAVLSIDADEPGAFEERESEDLHLCLLEFAQRISFEMLLRCLLEGGAE